MNKDNIPLLDAAFGVFLRYGFKRTTMGDIAKAAGLSRQSLYARFANKDEVYAAGLELYAGRILEELQAAWATSDDIGTVMDHYAEISVIPSFEMLRATPDATDMVAGVETPEGRAAMAKVTEQKCAALAAVFEKFEQALSDKGLNSGQLSDFVETTKHAMLKSSTDRAHLDMQLATLKASVVALTSG
jgi:AcrR family transcriptional regulator